MILSLRQMTPNNVKRQFFIFRAANWFKIAFLLAVLQDFYILKYMGGGGEGKSQNGGDRKLDSDPDEEYPVLSLVTWGKGAL